MAEKPRLKKSDEILGSIIAEPAKTARGKRAGGGAPEKNGGQPRRETDAQETADQDEFLEEIELTDDPVLPSAQSLAEKLMPKKTTRGRGFGAYEPAPRQTARTDTKPSAAQPASIEFGTDSGKNDKPDYAPVEFQVAPAPAETPAIEFGDTSAPEQAAAPPRPQQTPPPQPRQASPQRQAAPPSPTVAEYTFPSFSEPETAESRGAEWEFSADTDGRPTRERAKREPAQQQEEPRQQTQPGRERIIRPLKAEAAAPSAYEPPQETFESPPPSRQEYQPRQAARTEPAEPEISEAEKNRQEFMKRIASQFEVQFEEKFEDGALKPREKLAPPEPVRERPARQREPLFPPREPLFTQREPLFPPNEPPLTQREPLFPQREPMTAPGPKPAEGFTVQADAQNEGEDFLTYVQRQERERKQRVSEDEDLRARFSPDREPQRSPDRREDSPALGFIEKFEKDIRAEEEQRSEDFKETLSQKFMRERERYMKELGIDNGVIEPDEAAQAASTSPPQRRRLDFQIQPEMHMQDGVLPPHANGQQTRPAVPGPVTYNRGGIVKPQAEEDNPAVRGMSMAPERGPAAKKTGEQLLMEHTMRARGAVPQHTSQPANLKFTFETPEERMKKEAVKKKGSVLPTEKWPRRIVFIAMAAGLFSIGLVAWSMVSYYNLASGFSPASESAPEGLPATVEDRIEIYHDSVFTQTATANNIVFKNAGTLLKNAQVNKNVIIENVEGTGRIRLEDVKVDAAISVNSSGSDILELHNVEAETLIIKNPQTNMTVNVTGNTSIGVVEVRTNATVKQMDIGVDSDGIRGMKVTAPESGGEINASLDGLSLRSLEAEAETSILTFLNNTRAETVSVNGSLSLSGSGRVSALSIGSKIGQGAGGLDERKDIILFVKDVEISNLNVKSPMTLNLATSVDSISTSDAITLGGEARVGSLTLNAKANSTQRLLIDIVSANVQTVYSNTPSRINVTSSAHVTELVADASTYILGNKVNNLKVNADDVIYEREPDSTSVAVGIKPPQSKAENPNIDFNLTNAQPGVTDVTGENFATTCGHSRESGGYLVGDGSKDAPYEVTTAMQLAHAGSHLASYFIQTADIDISAESALAGGFPSIGGAGAPFEGVFDGKGYAISKLKIISQAENVGLFGANKGTVQNVRLVSGDISSAATSPSFAGGIAGLNYDGGQIRSSSNGAIVSGNQYTVTGGIAGGNLGGRIHDCYNYAKISGVDIVGGIVGSNRQSASVTGSYNAGELDGRDEVGAVAGRNDDATIANCYFLDTSSSYGIGSGSGTATARTSGELSSAQMAADLSAGNDSSLWTSGSAAGGYAYPVHRRPE